MTPSGHILACVACGSLARKPMAPPERWRCPSCGGPMEEMADDVMAEAVPILTWGKGMADQVAP